jgi:hypothetical protein
MEEKQTEPVSDNSFKMVWKQTELAELKKKKASLERQVIRLAERIVLKEKEIQKLNLK